MKSYFFLLAANAVYGASHSTVPTCACLAQDLGFTIDCTKTSVIDAAYDYLTANCNTNCAQLDCPKNWAIVESHHDFCLHDQVPKEVEIGFHALEQTCPKICSIGRMRDDDHVACPATIPGMPGVACPDVAGVVDVVNDLYSLDCATTSLGVYTMAFNLNGFNFNQSVVDSEGRVINFIVRPNFLQVYQELKQFFREFNHNDNVSNANASNATGSHGYGKR
jgi:hypothetical protein